jgi:hypothetical protein
MSASQIMFEQQHLAPKADLSRYAGRWVLVRDGAEVIASGDDPAALRRRPEARLDDVLIPVPLGAATILVS